MTEYIPSREADLSYEPLGLAATTDLLSSFGNHEGKALTLLFLSTNNKLQSSSEMGHNYHAFLSDADWKPTLRQPFNYCVQSLEPLGQVVKASVKGSRGATPAYKLSEAGQTYGIPLAGTLLEWSLDHPELSLSQVFGPTASGGETRSPQNRFKLLSELLSAPQRAMSITDIAGHDPDSWRDNGYHTSLGNMDAAARSLQKIGLVELNRVSEGNLSRFIIHDPNYPVVAGAPRGPVNEAIYDFLRVTYAKGQKIFDIETCYQHVANLLCADNAAADTAQIWRQVMNILGPRYPLPAGVTRRPSVIPGIERVDTFNEGDHTRMAIPSDKVSALSDLVNRIYGIADGNEYYLEQGRAFAAHVRQTPRVRVAVNAKVKTFSTAANKQPIEQTVQQVISILRASEAPLSTETIQTQYEADHKRVLSKASIRFVLRHLTDADEIEVSQAPVKAHLKIRQNLYALKVQSQ